MSVKLLLLPWLLAGALMAVPNAGATVFPPNSDAPAKFTPQLIHPVSVTLPPPLSKAPSTTPPKAFPAQDIFPVAPLSQERNPNGCTQDSGALCYDYRTGRALYKPMRKLLPSIPGMIPYNLSIRRDKVLAQYTFK